MTLKGQRAYQFHLGRLLFYVESIVLEKDAANCRDSPAKFSHADDCVWTGEHTGNRGGGYASDGVPGPWGGCGKDRYGCVCQLASFGYGRIQRFIQCISGWNQSERIPITNSTNLQDASGTSSSKYTVRAVVGGTEQAASAAASVWGNNYLSVPLSIPAGGTTPDGVAYTYSANDASAGDLDGDGEYELIVKWDPSNSKDNSQSGYTGEVFIDAYKLNGTRLWRISLGKNIRAGAHYTQFMVYDLDGDGKAEVAMKTADASKDYRNSSGYVLSGPEFLTIFNGQTGKALSTVNYEPARGNVSDWGDNYGNRVDRFLAAIAYLDGERPSLVMARGYYTRTVLVAYNWRNGQLTKQWTFDSNTSGNAGYAGQGNHNLSVADVDGDGKDEIIYGAMAVDDNGKGLYTTGLHHGDAMHLTWTPTVPGWRYFRFMRPRPMRELNSVMHVQGS